MIIITQMFNKNGLTYVIIFTHSNMCELERCFSSIVINTEATATGGVWRCLYAQPRVLLRFIALVQIRNRNFVTCSTRLPSGILIYVEYVL